MTVLSEMSIGIRANFFLGGGAEPSLPEKFFDSTRLTISSAPIDCVSIACSAERCVSYDRFRLSVCLSDTVWYHAKTTQARNHGVFTEG